MYIFTIMLQRIFNIRNYIKGSSSDASRQLIKYLIIAILIEK